MKAFEPTSNSAKIVYSTITIEMWIVLRQEFIFITYFPSSINNLWLLIFPSVYLPLYRFSSSASFLLKSVTGFGTQTDNYYSFLLEFQRGAAFLNFWSWYSTAKEWSVIHQYLDSYSKCLFHRQNVSSNWRYLKRYSLWKLKDEIFWKDKLYFVIWNQLLNAFEL